MSMAGVADAARQLRSMMGQFREISDLVQTAGAVTSMAGKIGGHSMQRSPFGAGEGNSGATSGFRRLTDPVGSLGHEALRFGAGMLTEKPYGLAADTARVGLMFGSSTEQQVGDQALKAGGRLLGKGLDALTNPLDPGNWVELGAEIVAVIPLMEQLGDALTSTTENLKKYDSTMAAADVAKEIGQIRRDRETAMATGDTTFDLVMGLEELKDELQPIREMITNELNEFMTASIGLATDAVRYIKASSTLIHGIAVATQSMADYFTNGQVSKILTTLGIDIKGIRLNTAPRNRGTPDKQAMDVAQIARSRAAIYQTNMNPIAGGGY